MDKQVMAIFVWTEYDADAVAKSMTKTQLNLVHRKAKRNSQLYRHQKLVIVFHNIINYSKSFIFRQIFL